jgi:hypothetical protein
MNATSPRPARSWPPWPPEPGCEEDGWTPTSGGGHLDDDTIGAVKPELTGRLEKNDDLEQLSRRGVDRPFFTMPTTSR